MHSGGVTREGWNEMNPATFARDYPITSHFVRPQNGGLGCLLGAGVVIR